MYEIIHFKLKVMYHLYLNKAGIKKNGNLRNSCKRTETGGSERVCRRNVLWLTRQLSPNQE